MALAWSDHDAHFAQTPNPPKKTVERDSCLDTMRAGVTMSSALRFLALALVAAAGCANAGNGGTGPGDDSPQKVDAATSTPKMDAHTQPIDSLPPIDSPGQQIDAPLQQIDAAIDAPDQMGPFCSSNSQCTNAGECCFDFGTGMGFCVPGDVILGQCFPSM